MKNPFSKKAPSQQEAFLRTYLDCIAPGIVKFEVDHYIFGSTYRCVWALREYPASTEAQALLRELGEKSGVTLRIYCRQVSPGEEDHRQCQQEKQAGRLGPQQAAAGSGGGEQSAGCGRAGA